MNSLRSMVERDLEDAAVSELSPDHTFGIAYSAALILAKMVLAASGYRARGQGAHQTTFEALELALGSSVAQLITYFHACRRKRNQLSYDVAGSVTDSEAQELRQRTEDLQKRVEAWIQANCPHLA